MHKHFTHTLKSRRALAALALCTLILIRGASVLQAESTQTGDIFLPLLQSQESFTDSPDSQPTPEPSPGFLPTPPPNQTQEPPPADGETPPVVFVSRQIPDTGSIYWDEPNDMPGVGPYSRFRVAAPGKLLVRESDGSIRTLIDGANPTEASMHLIDVNAPDVSYDGNKIVFAGFSSQGYDDTYDTEPLADPGNWRLYTINADGSDLSQITFADQSLDYARFGAAAGMLQSYDDTDPAWLPDGRIVFSSTRWPSFAHYGGARTSNLYVVKADGANLQRITAERNGADRPVVDPITGKIVYARWWRNHRFAVNSLDTITASGGGYEQRHGLTTNRYDHFGGEDALWRNQWHPAAINPDGTELEQWGGLHHTDDGSHVYGGAFLADGRFVANYFPMSNMTEAAGFGGLRLYQRGPGDYEPLMGITYLTLDYVNQNNPTSFGIFHGNYASEAAPLPDGRLIISWADSIEQKYGLYVVNLDGSNRRLLYNNDGTAELRAKVLAPRPVPPVIPDTIEQTASLLPPPADGPYDQDGTFVFDALNIHFNAPVDTIEEHAPPIGSADVIRFFVDHQRTSSGSFPHEDWPILLDELSVNADGSVRNPNAPANVPLFEQLRTADGRIPEGLDYLGGIPHVAGMNFGRPGEVQRCVGCHVGHTMIEVPESDEAARWTNLAPGAAVTVSSSRDADYNRGLVDRQVQNGPIWEYWTSASGQSQNQWVELTFPVPVNVRTVRLYNPRFGDEANSSIQVEQATVRLYGDAGGTNEVAQQTTGELAVAGTDVAFDDVRARVVRIEIDSVSGTFYDAAVAGLAEVEVIARGAAE